MAEVYFAAPPQATPLDCQALRDGWIRLLERWEWEWFCPFTFRDLVHPEAADKRFRVLLSQANRALYGHRWYKKGEMWASSPVRVPSLSFPVSAAGLPRP